MWEDFRLGPNRYCSLWDGQGCPLYPPTQICSILKECITTACSSGTLILGPKAYKACVGDISPQCGIEQIHADGYKGHPWPSQSKQYLIGAETIVLPQCKMTTTIPL